MSLAQLKAHQTARSEFDKAMEYPIKELQSRFAKVTLDKKPAEVNPWPGEGEIKELIDMLKSIDPGKTCVFLAPFLSNYHSDCFSKP